MKPKSKSTDATPLDPRYESVASAFVRSKDVTRETGKGFGSGSLKVNGRIFAMITSRGEFVVKLPARRVDELTASRQGRYFEPRPGRRMKEWFVATTHTGWIALAKEAHQFVKKSAK